MALNILSDNNTSEGDLTFVRRRSGALLGGSVLSRTEYGCKVVKLSLGRAFEGISWGRGGVSVSLTSLGRR